MNRSGKRSKVWNFPLPLAAGPGWLVRRFIAEQRPARLVHSGKFDTRTSAFVTNPGGRPASEGASPVPAVKPAGQARPPRCLVRRAGAALLSCFHCTGAEPQHQPRAAARTPREEEIRHRKKLMRLLEAAGAYRFIPELPGA